MANEIRGSAGFTNIADHFKGINNNIRIKDDGEGGLVLYTNSSRMERLKDWFSTSRTERESNREKARSFILDTARFKYGAGFPLAQHEGGAITGAGLSALQDAFDKHYGDMEAGRQKMLDRVTSPQFGKLLASQKEKYVAAQTLEPIEHAIVSAIKKNKTEILIGSLQEQKAHVEAKLANVKELTEKVRQDPNYLIKTYKVNGNAVGLAHVKDEQKLNAIKEARDNEIKALNKLMGKYQMKSATNHLEHNADYGNFVAAPEITIDDDGAEWTVTDEMGDIENKIYTLQIQLQNLVDQAGSYEFPVDADEMNEIRKEIVDLQRKKVAIETDSNRYLNGSLQERIEGELTDVKDRLTKAIAELAGHDKTLQTRMKAIPDKVMPNELRAKVETAKTGSQQLHALQTHLNNEKLKAKLGDARGTIDQLRSNIQTLRWMSGLARTENVPVEKMSAAFKALDQFEELKLQSYDTSGESTDGVQLQPRQVQDAAVAETTKSFLTKTGKSNDEKAQVVDQFMAACNINKEELAQEIGKVIRHAETILKPANPLSDEQVDNLAQQIRDQNIYQEFNYWSPQGYDTTLARSDLPAHITADGKASFKNLMPDLLAESFRAKFKKSHSPEAMALLNHTGGNHYNVTAADGTQVQIPDDGVCLFAACLYTKLLDEAGKASQT